MSGAAQTTRGSESLVRAEVNYKDRNIEARASYLTIGENVRNELSFIPRVGIHKLHTRVGTYFRPRRLSGWLRDTNPHLEFENVARTNGALDSRYVDVHWPLNFQDSSFVEIGLNPSVENLTVPFVINARRGFTIAPGRYEFNEWFATWRTNGSAPFAMNGRWGVGDFYDGSKQSYQLGGTTPWHGRFNAGVNVTRNQLRLSAGSYSTNLITARVKYGFSTKASVNALVQHNTDAREWTSNVRFKVIHRPLSDFLLVLNERRDSRSGRLLERALLAKVTYIVAF